ncbi:putative WRKY transcription factor 56 [Castilleja foliolosa]|uniref:WRKY transcription factor 56 n=1 Tax=Castilleja foliolosa TaxID=1961234 RepID=A0ABD3D031_9LAMI
MEGENFPYFYVDPSLFPLSDPLHDSMAHNNVFDQSMQNPQFGSSDQIDLANLLCGGRSVQENTTNLSVTSNYMRDVENVNCGNKKGKIGRKKKYVPPRVAFHTRSPEDILDDGYKWRKYGQKSVKNSVHPRSYYRCTHHTCNVKKQIQRLSKDTNVVVTTYEGIHNHPCEKLMETLSPLLRQLQFLSRF